MLVDLSSERTAQNLAAGDDDFASSYQFAISTASTQPTDRGEWADANSEQITLRSFPTHFLDKKNYYLLKELPSNCSSLKQFCTSTFICTFVVLIA